MITVTKSSIPPFEEYCNEIKDIWDSRWLTNMGPKHREFQKQLEDYLGVKHVTLYSNGHLALENIIAAMKFPPGSEVITTPFTFVSTTHAIVRNNLIPVFCDIRRDNYTVDADSIESLITEKTVAILPVHVYGNMCDVKKLSEIAQRYNLKVIYDGAHSFGVKLNGVSSAAFGDATMFSFHATKVFNTIEGGAICYNDDTLVPVLDDLKNFGIRGTESCEFVGGNAKMNEFQAAMGLCNLRHIEEEIGKRRIVANIYDKRFEGVAGISIMKPQEDISGNYAYYPIVFNRNNRFSRDDIYNRLYCNGVNARKYFFPLTCDMNCFKEQPYYCDPLVKNARDISNSVLTLPMYGDLQEETVNRIADIVLMRE